MNPFSYAVAPALLLPLLCIAQVTPGSGSNLREFESPSIAQPPSRLEMPILDTPAMVQKLAGKVSRFRLSGLTAVSAKEVEAVTAPWTGKTLNAAELSLVLNAVRGYLRQRGLFAADAYFPDQTVVDGVIEIAVLEGRVGAITLDMDHDARVRRPTAEAYLSRIKPGSLIARGDFDSPLLLLNDLPGVRASPSLTRGSAPGTADLQVRVDDEPVAAGYVQLDNHEIREVGEYRLTGHLRLRNPLGIGDLATAQYTHTHTSERKLGAVSYSLPVGTLGTRIGARIANQEYRLGGDFDALHANGRYLSGQLRIAHPFLRTNDSNVLGEFQWAETRYHDRIDSISETNDFRYRMASLNVYADKADNLMRGGNTSVYLQYRKGHVYLDTPGASANDAATLGLSGGFQRARLRLAREQALSEHTGVSLSFLAQMASKNLDGGLKLQLGGNEGVRAYGLAELFVDQGHLARIDYYYVLALNGGWHAKAGLFADSARGRINKNPQAGATDNTQSQTGYGTSFAVRWRDKTHLDLTFAWPTSPSVTDTHRHLRIWASLRQNF